MNFMIMGQRRFGLTYYNTPNAEGVLVVTEEPLLFEIATGHVPVGSIPACPVLAKRPTILRLDNHVG